MKKIMMTIAAVLYCCLAPALAMAQSNVEEVIKQVEQKVKLADKNPTNGKMQLEAGQALIWNNLGDKRDPERSMTYANRALKIAEEQIVLQDTLKGETYLLLAELNMMKGDTNKAFEYTEKGLEAFSQELGRYDRWTIYKKILVGYLTMMYLDIRRGSLMIQQAFLDSEMIPQEQRIQNLKELTVLYEMALEYSMADLANKMKRGVPLVVFDGKRYLILDTGEWNMEKPIVGWTFSSLMNDLQGGDEEDHKDVILCDFDDVNAPLRLIKANDENRPEFKVSFMINPADHRYLNIPEDNSRLWFLNEDTYKQLLEKYHAFKKEMKSE